MIIAIRVDLVDSCKVNKFCSIQSGLECINTCVTIHGNFAQERRSFCEYKFAFYENENIILRS